MHWLPTMVAVADAAALHRAVLPQDAPQETRAVIDAVGLCLRDLAHTAGTDGGPAAAPDAAAMISDAASRLRHAGADPVDDASAANRFAELRAGYGALGAGLASAIAAPTS